MHHLQLGDGFGISTDFATEAWAILARRGAGKSNAGAVVVEELDRCQLPFVVIDPKGDWWGIRSSADGKSPGLAVPVFGGRHGDVPLEPMSGQLIADLVLGDQSSYLSCVLDVSQMTITEQRRFLTDFGDRLFREKDEQGVLTLIFEEAHEYLPQVVPRDSTRLVSVYQRIVKQGRQRGLGVGMLTQRSAVLNKDVLTQIGALIPMWTMSPQDRAAIKAWVEVGGDAPELINSLHSMKPGEAWMWWPEAFDEQFRFKFRRRWTFDSGATPQAGKKRAMPRTLADVDLDQITKAMAETIEKVKADDPKELRKRIRELERELTEVKQAVVELGPASERVEVPVLTQDQEVAIAKLLNDLNRTRDAIESTGDMITSQLTSMRSVQNVDRMKREQEKRQCTTASKQQPASLPHPSTRSTHNLGKTERTVLTVLVQHGPMDNGKLALLSGYSAKASTIGVALAKLRRLDLVEQGQPNRAAEAGVEALGTDIESLPQGGELIDYWRTRFGKTERLVLDALIELHPLPGSNIQVAELTGYSPTASTIGVALSKLRKSGVVGGWHLSQDFVDATGL